MSICRYIHVAAFIACGTLWQSTAHASLLTTEPVPVGVGTERGVVTVHCRVGRTNHLFRGAVLDLGLDEDSDLVLTAAHGLPARRNHVLRRCRVLGAHGRTYRIADVWRATPPASKTDEDWAVLLVRHRLADDVQRLRPARVTADALAQLAEEQAPVRLLLRRVGVQQGGCHLYAAERTREPEDAILYTCRSFPGLSGSPVLITIDGQTVVIGIHLGLSLELVDRTQLRSVSYGCPIDGKIAAAIEAAAARARR